MLSSVYISSILEQVRYIFNYTLLILWAALIFYLSSEGSDSSSGRSDAIVQTIQSLGVSWPQDLLTFLTRKAAHIGAYFVFGLLAYNVVRMYSLAVRKALLLSAGIVLLYAMSDEFHQMFVPGRSGEVRDVLIDTTAGTVGVMLAYLASKRFVGRRVVASSGQKAKNKV